jgi:hypothetical protein
MRHNSDPAFAGIQALKDKQRQQLEKFQQAASGGDWMVIHRDHYDWWMFPIDEPSMHGFKWTVYEGDVSELKRDAEYVDRYLLGVELLARSWGWDLRPARHLPEPGPGQCWQQWPIRLYKATKSVRLFGFPAEFESLKKLGKDLMSKGESMHFNNRDLSGLFRD